MEKKYFFKFFLVVIFTVLGYSNIDGQNLVPFAPRYDQAIKGDMLLIGNSNMGVHESNAYSGNETNDRLREMVYVDIDGDSSTFNSSTADLNVPDSSVDCYQIAYAGLYWTSVVAGSTDPSQIKFKTPGGSYMDITGTEVYFQNAALIGGTNIPDNNSSNTFVYYQDVTSIIQGLANPEGTYAVANISSLEDDDYDDYADSTSSGRDRGTNYDNAEGLSAGWALYVIYQDPNLTSKYITSFDGMTRISNTSTQNIPISGFRTIDTGPVRAKYAFLGLEGDTRYTGDYLAINGTPISATNSAGNNIRPSTNFFNSSVSYIDPVLQTPELFTDRNPSSSNTLGFDAGILNIPNASNTVIDNGDTSANITIGTFGDLYYFYFNAFSVEIIAPNIVLTKIVEDEFGNDISDQEVALGDELYYTIGFQNTGNDDATGLIIRDILPDNVVFNYPTDLGVLPTGVTVQSYDPDTREIIFDIDDSVIEENDPVREIRFMVTVVASCSLLNNACSNVISNQAYSTYQGTINSDFTISDDPSFSTNTGCLITPAATNFLADIDCSFEEEVILCGDSTTLTAGGGYDSYSWSTDPSGTPVIGTDQTLTVTETGTYYVHNTAIAPCQSIDQVFEVVTFGAGVTNPLIPDADEVVVCPNDGKELPNFYLCGANDARDIETGITDTTSIIWEKLDESSCTAVANQDCANEDTSCTWNQVGTGSNFTIDTEGQYRLTLNYDGGCFNRFFFNVYTNVLEPNVTATDIYCDTDGEIRVGGIPSGYEFSIDGTNYQNSNVFDISTEGLYTVYIRQVGVSPNPCVFTVPDVQIRDVDFSGSVIINQPLCYGDLGSVVLAANDARGQYSFSIYDGATLVNSVGPIADNDYTFNNLSEGTYTVNIETEDGCLHTEDIEIISPDELTATVALTTALTCEDGELTIYPVGGTAPYSYFINSTTDFQGTATYTVTSAGTYNITVVDYNNCTTETSITVEALDAPTFNVNVTDILCYNESTGVIEFNVTNANGYSIQYSIDNGATYSNSSTFSNLDAGTYSTIIQYSIDGVNCYSEVTDYTITQPDDAVTASGGVSQLAGCGASGEGALRITNPQGGTAPYEYSFDNQATWVTTSEAYVDPGTYTLYIRDSNGCIYAMPDIVLDPEPVPPTITVGDPDFNCDGSANATVTVNNEDNSTFSYTYYLDGVENTNTADPKTFLDVSEGSHVITVEYKLEDVPTFSNLLTENFGFGETNVESPGIDFYIFESQVRPGDGRAAISVNDGEYSVTYNIESPFGAWWNPIDHTSGDRSTFGRYLLVNIGDPSTTAGISLDDNFYKKRITDVIPNQPIRVNLFVANVIEENRNRIEPDLLLAVLDPTTGDIVSSITTGTISENEQWNEYNIELNPGNNTELDFVVRTNIFGINGNDIAIDDINVYQLPVSCVTTIDFPFVVNSGNAFSAEITGTSDVSCSGSSDGEITIAVENFDATNGYQYSVDGGVTWVTETTSPYTITGLLAAVYDVQIRYDDASDTCEFPFTQEIFEPTILILNVDVTPPTCLDGATLEASSSGGTAAYTYELLEDSTLNLVATFPANGVLTNVVAGNYVVRVTDSQGCTATTPVNITDPTGPTATINVTTGYCYDASTGVSLEVIASGGSTPYEYNINGGSFTSNNVFSNLTPGSYDIIVRDSNGCTYALGTETIEPELQLNAAVTKGLDCTTSPDAEIEISYTGGYTPYVSYEVSTDGTTYTAITPTPSASPFTYSVSTDGTYYFRITDAENCIAEASVVINPITNPTATETTVNPLCSGDSNGSVQIVASSGTAPYEYNFDSAGFTTTSLFENLSEGTYAYQVRDDNGCIYNGSVTLTAPTALTTTHTVTEFSCNVSNTFESAQITINVPTTGSSPYQYSFNGSNYSATNTLTINDNGSDQTITYSVRDDNGCVFSDSVTLTALNPPSDIAFSATTVTCLATTSDVTLTATDGVGVLTYSIQSPASATSNTTGAATGTFTGLAPDTYIFRVTDENNCYYEESFTVSPVTNIVATGNLNTDVACFGDSTGAVTFSISNFGGSYSYTLDGGTTVITGQTANSIPLTGLAAGTYTIEVTDEATGCTDTASVIVSQPANALALSATTTNVYCDDDTSQITVSASGGTPNYTYAAVISGASAPALASYSSNNVVTVDTNSATDLTWDVYVKDNNDCITFTTVTITADAQPTLDPIATQCYIGNDLTINLTGTVSVGTAMYSMGSGFQTSPTFTITAPGTYTFTIQDGNGCTASQSLVVNPQLQADALLTKDITCAAPIDATIDVDISGGSASYSTFEVSTDSGSSYTAFTPTLSGSMFTYSTTTAGTYMFRITDSVGCIVETNEVTVTTPVNPSITSVVQTAQITCSGEATAAIDVTIDMSLGQSPFVINVYNNTTSTDYGTQTSGLTAGNYTITVTDAKGCTDTDTINITEPSPIVLNYSVTPITCGTGGISLGEIIIDSVSGGTTEYTYHVTGANGYDNTITNQTGTTQVFEVVDFGLYEIIITDANGCTYLEQDILVASPPDDLDIIIADPTVDCVLGGQVDVSIGTSTSIVGSGPFYFAIYTGSGMTYDGSAAWQLGIGSPAGTTFTGLIPGVTYTFVVYDDTTGCYYYETAGDVVPTNSTLTSSNVVPTNITCTGSGNGNVSFDVNSTYGSDINVTYEVFEALSLTSTGVTGSGTVPSNGTLNVTNLGPLDFGTYVVVITEDLGAPNAGCSVATTEFNITESAVLLSVSASVSENENCNDLGTIIAVGQNGTSPYEYQAVVTGNTPDPSSWGTSNAFNLAGNQTYDIYIRDAYGCEQFDTIFLPRDAEPTIDTLATQCYVGSPISITITGTTYNSNATYSIGGAYQNDPNFTLNTPGTYTLSIQDDNGCIASTTYTVEPQLQLDADLTKDIDCTTSPDGTIVLTPSGGTGVGPYTYEVSINGGAFAVIASDTYTVTTSGTYEFRVTNSQSCQATSNIITVDPLGTPVATEIHTDISCNGGSDGTITVTASGTEGPYEYSIDGGTTFLTSNVFTGLLPNTYSVVVRDSKSCVSAPVSVTLIEPTIVVASPTLTQGLTCDASNASQAATITVTASGGSSPYTYSFDGGTLFSSNNTYTTNTPGDVFIVVMDSNGCLSATETQNVPALDPPTDLDFASTDITCINTTSDVTLTTTGGVMPVSYAILEPASATSNTTGDSTGTYTGLLPDTYLFEVTDANGCTYQESYTVNPVTNITVSGLLVSDVSCNGSTDGEVTFTVSNFSSTYSYSLDGGTTVITAQTISDIVLTGLPTGTHTIDITDEVTGCTATSSITVSEPTTVSLTETSNINANCNTGAQVTVTATGGTSPYTYAFVEDGVTPVAGDYTNSDSAILDASVNTNWDVYVLDVNNCPAMIDVTITTDPLPTVTLPSFASNQCNLTGDPYTFTVSNTTGIAPFEYSIDGGSSYQTSDTFTVNAPGTYTVTVKDANGCTATSTNTIEIYNALGITPELTTVPSCTDDDGVITVNATGGSGTYSYTISPSPATISFSGNVFSGVPSGTYTITVTDDVTTCTNSASITVEAATPVTFTAASTDVSCNGGSDGTITVDLPASNNNPIYTYEITAPIVVAAQTSNVFTGLSAGTYTIQVNSGRGCIETANVVVNEPNTITVAAPTVVEYACNTGVNAVNYASITVTNVTGGSSNYTIYEFIKSGNVVQYGANTSYTESDFSGGTYTINVYDDNGCVGSTTATISPFTSLESIDVTVDNAITCTNDEDITVTVNSTGPAPTNLEFTVQDIDATGVYGGIYNQTNTTGVFTGLPIGNYSITVINLDTNCTLETIHYVNDPNTFTLEIDSVVNVTCFSDTDGSVDVTFIDRVPTPTDESGAFSYTVFDSTGATVTTGTVANAGPTTISGLASGTYTITANLTNTPYCTVSQNFTVDAPTEALTITETHTEITCVSGNNDGSISVVASGGWLDYEYQLETLTGTIIVPYGSETTFEDLVANDYVVSVRDASGCIASVNVVLVNPDSIVVTAIPDTTMLTCYGDSDGRITVSAIGGQGSNYSYTLNMLSPTVSSSGPQTSPIFDGLVAGTYNVTVTDGYNCVGTSADITITQPDEVMASLVTTTTQTCTTDASLTLNATGGTGSYEYSETSDFAIILGTFTSSTTFAVTPGTYQYYVRDANACTSNVSNEITIDPLPDLEIEIDTENATINCYGDQTGVIIATAQGGLGNYIYTLEDSTGNAITPVIQDSPGIFTELPAGIYQVRVNSGDCLETSSLVEITEPDDPLTAVFDVTDVLCAGENDGMLEITASGGTGLIKYAISPRLDQFFDTPIFTDLAPGTYQAIAQDELGCFVLYDFTITEPEFVSVSIVPDSIYPEACTGDQDGEFSIEISGGEMPYSVTLDDVNGSYFTGTATQTQFDFTGLSGGDHILYVIDSNGCESEWNIAFPESVEIIADLEIEYCTNGIDATSNMVIVNVDDTEIDLTEIDYSLDGGTYQTENVFTDLSSGTHFITVRHSNTCEEIIDFEIEAFDALGLSIADGDINEIVATATGGSGGYEFTLNGDSQGSDSSYFIRESGDYTVTVTDTNGCSVSVTRYFEFIDICLSNYFTPNGDGVLDGWGPDCANQYTNLTFDIFDRYGRKIATLGVNDKWDGKYKGKELPTGDYWYIVKLNDKEDDRNFVGHFTLYR
ncbi:T9SS type B sorting domain-containing protein [Neotamlana laminarinivorans]|uniref:T9SS type B sorting domain-containing protein n=1 Tax=Neotamlana laminarinivorans TaxID=2883124 RepID=A0A9X1I0X4_9FLAO|nr:T9SS type B sorting domain-containing protein [Tamlana laminarinivorans]MCB4797964.1 T9SS type B sorting domain-containing protein [Tamlana laminarinivorans]